MTGRLRATAITSQLPAPPPPPPPAGWARSATYTPAIVPARAVDVGRIGMFVGGYFGLSFVFAAWNGLHGVLGVAASLMFLAGMLIAAERWRGTEMDALATMAAFGSTSFVIATTVDLGGALGFDGRALFWCSVATGLPAALATLLRFPHPILGLNVAIGATVLVVAAPLGDADRVATGKAVLLALLLAGIAITVDFQTRSRAGSLLHYASVGVFVIAKVLLLTSLGSGTGTMVLIALSGFDLSLALLLRRRSWAFSGWITLVFALPTVWDGDTVSLAVGSVAALVVAVPIVAAAVTVQREGERVRAMLLEALPPDLARVFPP